MPQNRTDKKIPIGISSCLLGHEVRYDGGHKRDRFIDQTLRRYFEFLPICPEVEIGMGVPREPIQLVNYPKGAIRAVGTRHPELDVTEKLEGFGRKTIPTLAGIRGYIFKSKSPSCGMDRVTVYTRKGMPTIKGRGIFAGKVMDSYPNLPVEEEGRLTEPGLREKFLETVFVYDRWLTMKGSSLSAAKLVDFHTSHKLLIMSHSQAACKRLDRLVASAGSGDLQKIADTYSKGLMESLKRPATIKSHSNVLQHLLGHLMKSLDPKDKKEKLEIIETYKRGQLPLIVPIFAQALPQAPPSPVRGTAILS